MSRQAKREPDVESNTGGHAGQDVLDFEDPSWIIDHHRHNLIQKISQPENPWFEVLVCFGGRRSAPSANAHNNQNHGQQKPSDGPHLEIAANKLQPTGPPNHGRLEEKEESYRINLSELQRLRLRQLQHRLIQHAVDLRYNALEPSGWAEDLRQYVQALQDYEYMGKYIWPPGDPFYVTGERFVDRCMLQVAMRGKENEADPLHWATSMGKWETAGIRPVPIGGTRDENYRQGWIRGLRQRVGMAGVGGIFLIVPMWLMVLHNTLYTALVSTTVFVVIFGLFMALVLDKLMDVMSGTAAYAAVLVVFVGLTTTKNTS
ncbi:hypothetical protein PV08_10920 [Exophiala spinifera]|uniref:DUF6594 domain-containing protein n=1 Tax=Exophiala spinifera TaxID=91928 RepID=A0A0D2AY38_9EURO|nr:uncharacterized protein PV08_10920 [Exophiala spinifera]KIW11618.1 hypothetical protein PV08_10920 [Exophiala spinifera]